MDRNSARAVLVSGGGELVAVAMTVTSFVRALWTGSRIDKACRCARLDAGYRQLSSTQGFGWRLIRSLELDAQASVSDSSAQRRQLAAFSFHISFRYSWTSWTAIAPSPTAEAT